MFLDSSGAVQRAQISRLPIPAELIGHIDPRAARDPECRQIIAQDWPKLLRLMDDLAECYEPDEIPIVDFLDLWQVVMRLSCAGVVFDDGFLAQLDQMQASIIGTDEDSDFDEADELIDGEDLDEDLSVDDLPCDVWECCEGYDDDIADRARRNAELSIALSTDVFDDEHEGALTPQQLAADDPANWFIDPTDTEEYPPCPASIPTGGTFEPRPTNPSEKSC